MQLLDPPQQLLHNIPEPLQSQLKDIVHNVQIDSDLCIQHPYYKPLELPPEALLRFRQLPFDLQRKYLSLQLRSFLYGIYYNGSLQKNLALDSDAPNVAVQDLENTTFMGVDLAFYDRLHTANHGEGYFSPDWVIVRQEDDGSIAVTKNGLTLHIQPDKHLPTPLPELIRGNAIAVRMPRNLVQNGFYMAVGNHGSARNQEETVRAYFNLTPEGAVAVMDSLTEALNPLLPFAFKALYNPGDYGRSDSAVLYFEKSNYSKLLPVLQNVYERHRSLFHSTTPLFTKEIAPGLAIAEEPNEKFAELESFGMNRCQIVTNGLLNAVQSEDESPENRFAEILKEFALLGIEVHRPYLNAKSEDIYTPLHL